MRSKHGVKIEKCNDGTSSKGISATFLHHIILYLLFKSHVPTTSMPVSHGPGAKFLSRAQMNLHLVQCHLDHQGASKLIVDLVIKSSNNTKISNIIRILTFFIASKVKK